MKKIILLSTLIICALVATGTVYAVSANLSVSPTIATHNVGTVFNVLVNLDTQGNKVCVVKGTLNFSNLTCKSITVASGVMAQTTPTCASPNFTLGIPGCTITAQSMLSASVAGNNSGQATVSITGVNVIGEGTTVAFAANSGVYSITTAPKPVPVPEPEETVSQNVEQQIENQEVQTLVEQPSTENQASNNSNPFTAGLLSGASPYLWPLLILLIVLGIIYLLYILVKKRKK